MHEAATELEKIGREYDLELSSCCEAVDLSPYGIQHNKCIDDDLIRKLFPADKQLMEFIGGEQADCGCIASKDIGEYDTCPLGCTYCYANRIPGKIHLIGR